MQKSIFLLQQHAQPQRDQMGKPSIPASLYKVNDSTSSFFMNNDFPSCSACGEPCFEKSFACLKCKFLIQELCLQLPHEIQNFFHPCPLSLQQETTNFTCRACEKSRSQFAYHCNRCNFCLDVECAQMFTRNFEGQNYILSFYHHHPLSFVTRKGMIMQFPAINAIKSSMVKYAVATNVISISTDHVLQPHNRLNILFTQITLLLRFLMKSCCVQSQF